VAGRGFVTKEAARGLIPTSEHISVEWDIVHLIADHGVHFT
jgi:hypothetical protein